MNIITKGNEAVLIKIIAVIKKAVPSNLYFFSFFIFLKYMGLILVTNNFANNQSANSENSIGKLLKAITFFGTLNGDSLCPIDYNAICITIYFLILFPFLLMLLVYKILQKEMQNGLHLKSSILNVKIKKHLMKVIHICSVIIIFLVLFSQHVMEILAFPYYLVIARSINDNKITDRVKAFEDSLLMSNLVYLILNSVFIIVMNVFVFYFLKLYHHPFISIRKETVTLVHNRYFSIICMISFNLQTIHYYDTFSFTDFHVSLLLVIIGFICSCLLLLFSMRSFVLPTFCSYLRFSIFLFCFFGSIIDFIMYYSMDKEMTFGFFLITLAIQLILLFISLFCMFYFMKRMYEQQISENLFIKNKKINPEYIQHLVHLLSLCVDDFNSFSVLFSFIEQHKKKCNPGGGCPCEEFDSDKFIRNFQEKKFFMKLSDRKRLTCFFTTFPELVLLVENELRSYIYNLDKHKKIHQQLHIVLLHCNFIFLFKRNALLSLYFIQEYIAKIKLPLEYSIYFYHLAKKIIRSRQKSIKLDQTKESLNLKFQKFIGYYQILEDIKALLLMNCNQFEKILSLKSFFSDINMASTIARNSSSNLEKLFEEFAQLNSIGMRIQGILEENFQEESLKNPEGCYLLTNFYEITNKGIPSETKNLFIPIDSYDLIQNFDSCYIDKRFEHPLIISLTSSNSNQKKNNQSSSNFLIEYISQKLCDSLGYSKDELIHSDFHTLIPPFLSDQHKIEMKKCLLLNEIFKIEKETFVLSKDQYYVIVQVTCGCLPSLKRGIQIICDITNPGLIEPNRYQMILDKDTNIAAMSKNFGDKFRLTYDFLSRLHVTFESFFGINFRKFTHGDIPHNFLSAENLVNVFSQSNLHILKEINENNTKDGLKKIQTIKISKPKEKLLPNLKKIQKSIEEHEYDTDWLDRLNYLEKLFTPKLNGKLGIMTKDVSNLSSFFIKIDMKNLGDVMYYAINLYDKEKDFLMEQDEGNPKYGYSRNKLIFGSENFNKMKKFYDNIKQTTLEFGKKREKVEYVPVFDLNENVFGKHKLEDNSRVGLLFENLSSYKRPFVRDLKSRNSLKWFNSESNDFWLRCLLISINVLSIILCCLYGLNFLIKQEIYSFSKQITFLNVDGILLKQAIYETSTILSSGCLKANGLETESLDGVSYPMSMLKKQISFQSGVMFKYYTNYISFLFSHIDYSGIEDIYNTIFEIENYFFLGPDWKAFTKESTFESQIHYYHFQTGYLNRTDSLCQCRLHEFFLGTLLHDDEITPATSEESLFYYFIDNVMTRFTNTVDKMIRKTNILQGEYMNNFAFEVTLYSSIILFFSIIIVILIGFVITNYRGKIFILLSRFMIKNTKLTQLEKNISNLKLILVSFDENVVLGCEDLKRGYDKHLQNALTPTPVTPLISANTPNVNKRLLESPQFLHLNKKEDLSETLPGLELGEGFRKKNFSLKIVKFSVGMLLIASIGYVLILLSSIIFDYQNFQDINIVNQMTISFMSTIPRFNEMVVYLRISALLNNPNYITVNPEDYSQLSYHSNLTLPEVNRNDSRYTRLGNSKFAFLFYEFQQHQLAYKYFNSEYHKKFLLSRKIIYDEILNTPAICASVVDNYISIFGENFVTHDYLLESCTTIGNGINQNGILMALESASSTLLDIYLDFYTAYQLRNSTATLTLTHIESQRAIRQCEIVYNCIWDLLNYYSFNDLQIFFDSIMSVELVIEFVGITFNFVFLGISIFIVIRRMKIFHFNFVQAIGKINKATGLT